MIAARLAPSHPASAHPGAVSRVAAACGLALLTFSLASCSLLAVGGGERTSLASLEGGEALVQSGDGAVFVTGRQGVFRLRGLDDAKPALAPVPIRVRLPAACQFTGAAVQQGWLFAACTTAEHSYLLQGALARSGTALTQIAELKGVALASGMAAGAGDRLFVADSRQRRAALSAVTVTRHTPLAVATAPWFDDQGTGFPNGVQASGGVVYLTSAGRLLAIPVRRDGAAGEARVVLTRMTFLDDFQVLDRGFLLTDYTFNRLLLVNGSGAGLGSFAASTRGPTAVLVAAGPDGKPRVLVTERERGRLSEVRVPDSLQRYLKPTAGP